MNFKKYTVKENVRFFGRTAEVEGEKGVFFNASGSGFTFTFIGTAAKAYFYAGASHDTVCDDEHRGYISVFVDDMPISVSRFQLDRMSDWYTLAENLPFGEHTVRVIKGTEVGFGRASVTEIMCEGDLVAPQKEKPLKLEFIGDSITCGYGNICSNGSSEFTTREEDFSQTYAAFTAKLLDAELSCIAASGNGFYHDYGCNTHNLIPELYAYTDKMLDEHCGKTARKWDFQNDKRDAVIIKLGQNDGQFCSGADLPEAERKPDILAERRSKFQEVAYSFLSDITIYRPDTPIVLIVEDDMLLKNELINAAEKIDSVHLLKIQSKRPYEAVGANGHWSVHTHSRVALQLSQFLKELLCLQ
ncbi:MAG: hypothetical protein IKK24_07355 [Clostridia bacterium]|nr:hypothetical protein [Clostridia bacterium]